MNPLIKSAACLCRAHCRSCRTQQWLRDGWRRVYTVPPDFDTVCPFGVTLETLPPPTEVKLDPTQFRSLAECEANKAICLAPCPAFNVFADVTCTELKGCKKKCQPWTERNRNVKCPRHKWPENAPTASNKALPTNSNPLPASIPPPSPQKADIGPNNVPV